MKVILLGTGTSHGVPMIACDCSVCTSSDPKDKRTRPSIVVQYNDRTILIDTSPDIRSQCLANDIRRVDTILYTHHHADHVTGLDDVRIFNALQHAALPCYASADTLRRIGKMFSYAFVDDPDYPSHKPRLDTHIIEGPLELFGKIVIPLRLLHGKLPILGFRFDDFAYCTDCSEIPDKSFGLLENLDVLILDGLRRRPHPTHFNIEQAVEVARQIGARQTFFTHIAHELGHQQTNAELPLNMALGYDGQTLEFPEPNR